MRAVARRKGDRSGYLPYDTRVGRGRRSPSLGSLACTGARTAADASAEVGQRSRLTARRAARAADRRAARAGGARLGIISSSHRIVFHISLMSSECCIALPLPYRDYLINIVSVLLVAPREGFAGGRDGPDVDARAVGRRLRARVADNRRRGERGRTAGGLRGEPTHDARSDCSHTNTYSHAHGATHCK